MDAGNPRGGNRPGVEAALQARGASPAIQIERPSSNWAFVLIFQHSKFTSVEILSHLLAAHPGLEAPGPPGRGVSSTGMSLECLLPAPFPPQAINRCLLEICCRPGSHHAPPGSRCGQRPFQVPHTRSQHGRYPCSPPSTLHSPTGQAQPTISGRPGARAL